LTNLDGKQLLLGGLESLLLGGSREERVGITAGNTEELDVWLLHMQERVEQVRHGQDELLPHKEEEIKYERCHVSETIQERREWKRDGQTNNEYLDELADGWGGAEGTDLNVGVHAQDWWRFE
jgi:hypothetical protein